MNAAEEIIRFIHEAPKKTPVKVYLKGKPFDMPGCRVFGVDASLVDALDAEYVRLRDAGTIDRQTYTWVTGRQASAADDPSWVWHFHHTHISFCAESCDQEQKPGAGGQQGVEARPDGKRGRPGINPLAPPGDESVLRFYRNRAR
jgi:hypothetical protein